MSDEKLKDGPEAPPPGRRSALGIACGTAAGVSLVAGYGTFFAYAGRYLYPARPTRRAWMYVVRAAEMYVGESKLYTAPSGARIAIARQGDQGEVGDFIALSGVCPHLGCQVHWEGQNNRFFCPCHNGVFDPKGAPVSGPPAEANQSLPEYPLKLEDGLLYIEVEMDSLGDASAAANESDTPGAGMDGEC